MTAFRVPFAVLLAALPQLVFAQLDDVERAIVAWSEDHANDAIALIERQVNINSGTMNAAGVRAVGEVLDAELQALGMDTEWIDLSAVNRGGHLFGRLNTEREGGTKFLLIGHLDTVFEPGDEFQEWSIDGNTATEVCTRTSSAASLGSMPVPVILLPMNQSITTATALSQCRPIDSQP